MMKKRILVPYFTDYYLFEYLTELAKAMQAAGYEVTVVTADAAVFKKFSGTEVEVGYLPLFIRLLMRRAGNIVFRILLWLSGYVWVWIIRNRYDFSIIPWDNKPLWYLLLKTFPSLTVHNTTNLMDLSLEIAAQKSPRNHKAVEMVERIIGIKLLPRLAGVVLKHNKIWYLDKLLGLRSDNLVQGFSGIDYVSVTGNRMKKTLIEAGLEKLGTKIIPVGNSAYDGFQSYSKDFTIAKKVAFKQSIGLSGVGDMFAMFLSPSSFTERQIQEVIIVVDAVLTLNLDASLCIKFHPKTEARFLDIFDNLLSQRTSNYKIISGFTGERVNLDIVLSSKCILQKQSTVGFIAMLTSVPIISYNLADTDYYDDMYKYMQASWHCKNHDDLAQGLSNLDDEVELRKLKGLQDVACSNFCIQSESTVMSIVGIIDNHFESIKPGQYKR